MLSSATPTFSKDFLKDDFVVTAAEPWFKAKVQVIHQYMEAFIGNVSGRVDDLVVVDLFSRNGFCSTGHQRDIFPESILSLLAAKLPVSKWILCEEDIENAKALKIRINRHFRKENVLIFEQHPSALIDKFRYYVPQSKGKYKVATLCIVDPFNFKIELSVLEKLAGLGFSFVIPYTFTLNSKINYTHYLSEKEDRIKKYLGNSFEADKLKEVTSNEQFYKKIVKYHQNRMLTIGLSTSLSAHKLESNLMELPVYYVGMYSKNFSTRIIQQEVKQSALVQMGLF